MPSTVPSILLAFTKEVLVVLHFRQEETEAQKELPNVSYVIRKQSLSSPSTHTVSPQRNQGQGQKNHSLSQRGAPWNPLCLLTFPGFCLSSRVPRPQRRIPFTGAARTHVLWGLSCPHFCLPFQGV